MKISVPILAALAVVSTLAGCSQKPAPSQAPSTQAAPGAAPQTALGRMVAGAIGDAKVKLAKENINLNGQFFSGEHRNVFARVGHKDPADTRPDAELTPSGELLIDGKPVPVNAAQHTMLVQYRQAIMTVAESGMALGVQGADLGGQAIGEVFKGLMSGNPDQIDKNINAQAGKIEAQAMQLCRQLRPVHELQQQLAVAVPQFAPYATLKASDIDDCDKRRGNGNATTTTAAERAEVQQQIRGEIREGIRSAVRGSVEAGTQATSNQNSSQPSAAR
ncbi:MAG: hypothetical protein EPO46_10890 [Lysobacter sp.]|nr:MAG: hypothetical protein EPO46_10890 [Lysobacter sp.]